MISIIDSGKLVNTDVSPMVPRSCEMVGLSTDTKPTGVSVGNGWSFIEMDTGKIYFYEAEDEEWLEFAGSGGGGGQGGNDMLVITFNDDTGVCDTAWSAIRDALAAGKRVVYLYTDTQSAVQIAQQEVILAVTHLNSKYQVYSGAPATDPAIAEADTENGYPVANWG